MKRPPRRPSRRPSRPPSRPPSRTAADLPGPPGRDATALDLGRVESVMERARRAGCLLCGRRAAFVGIWTPTAAYRRRLGEPRGKTRLVVYAVCAEHFGPAFSTAIEDAMLADAATDLARPEAN